MARGGCSNRRGKPFRHAPIWQKPCIRVVGDGRGCGGSEQVAGGLRSITCLQETEAGDSAPPPRFANYMLISQKILRFTLMAWRAPRYMQLSAHTPVVSGLWTKRGRISDRHHVRFSSGFTHVSLERAEGSIKYKYNSLPTSGNRWTAKYKTEHYTWLRISMHLQNEYENQLESCGRLALRMIARLIIVLLLVQSRSF